MQEGDIWLYLIISILGHDFFDNLNILKAVFLVLSIVLSIYAEVDTWRDFVGGILVPNQRQE